MSSIRDFRRLHTVLERRIKQLMIDLTSIFRLGKPIPPEERLAKADQLLQLARLVLDLLPLLHELERVLEKIDEQRELFVKAHRLNNDLIEA